MKKLVFIFILLSTAVFAQTKDIVDSLNTGKSAKDSVIYTNLKTKLTRSKVGKSIYSSIFKDVYNTNSQRKELSAIEINPYERYAGKIIGKITIKRLDVFGLSVNDTTRKSRKTEHFISQNFHHNTRENVIRQSFLLFKEGDKLSPQVLKENERIIRANPIIHDVRILVTEHKNIAWMVDVLVVIQDVWSVNVTATGSGTDNFSLGLEERNFQGRGNSLLNKVTWRADDPYQRLGWRTIYTIPYIQNSFVSGQVRFIKERDLSQYALHIYRPFLTIDTRNAGSFEAGYSKVREYKRLIINKKDSLLTYRISYYYADAWYGRAFKIDANNPHKQLVLAVRRSFYNYLKRPEVSADTNKLYWDRTTWLGSIGFSNRNYQRDFLVYGFGRTEDVPVGNLVSLTFGTEKTEFGKRGYGGIQFANGQYLTRGYLYTIANIGSYLKQKTFQQGTIGLQSFYFSRLRRIQGFHTRSFLNVGYTYGINRDDLDYLNISGKDGILGVNSPSLSGHKRLTLGYELVMFSHKSLLGFRMAYFGFTNVGLVSFDDKSLFTSKIYQGYGLGIRLRNENLTFNTIQIRLGYYPNIPNISSNFNFALDTPQPLKLRDFDISAPSIIPLR